MTPPHWRLILNGKSADDDDLREVVATLREHGIALEVRVTWENGDAGRYATEAIGDGVDSIVAAGGDGTLSEVASTLAHHHASAQALPALGLVPLGTANDFATAAGIPGDIAAAFEIIRTRAPRPTDLLRLEAHGRAHWAANLASGGFGTQVTVDTHDGLKKMLGGLAYLVTGMARLGRIEPIAASIHGPGFAWQGDFIALGIGNGRQAGGGQALCPEALVDDGLLDVTVIPELSGEVAGTLATVLTDGRHAALDQVATRARLPWVEIDAEKAFVLNLDGEPVEARHFRIDCVPGRVRIHLPADCPLLGA